MLLYLLGKYLQHKNTFNNVLDLYIPKLDIIEEDM